MKRFLTLLFLLASPAAAAERPPYRPAGSVALGAPDRWDYLTVADGRLYVAHGSVMTVVDAHSLAVLGSVEGLAGGTHGSAVAADIGQGFTDDGEAGVVAAFDLKTFKVLRHMKADTDADGMIIDHASGHLFVVNGDPGTLSVIDPVRGAAVATIRAGEKMEYLASDDRGFVYAAGEDKSDLLKIDTHTNMIVGRWDAAACTKPHGLAIDRVRHRLFMGCVNSLMMVMDPQDGHVVAKLPIGKGSDAIVYDAKRRRVFSSNGVDGTVTILQQTSADQYVMLPPLETAVTGRTMAVDPVSGRIFVVAGEVDHAAAKGNGKPRILANSLRLFAFDPAD